MGPVADALFLPLVVVTLAACLKGVKGERLLIGYLTGSRRRSGDDVYSRPGLSISGALSLAVEEVNREHPVRDNHSLAFLVAETFGDETESIYQTAYLWTQNVSAYIGPQETCVHEARLAASFNLPMISYYCARHESSDKQMFPTFSRTRPPDTQVSKSVVSVLLNFRWKKIAFLYSNANKSDYEGVAKTILKTLADFDIQVLFRKTWDIDYFHGFIDNPFRAIVEDTYLHCRIYVILGHYYEHVGLLVYMQEKGLFDQGHYFVVGVDIEQYDQENPEKYLRGLLKEETEDAAKEAYRSYLGIVGSPPIDIHHFDNFTVKVNAYMESPPFSFPNPLTPVGGLKRIRAEAAYLYDAVRIYASALNDTLAHGENPRDGRNMFKYIKERTYKSVMGYTVYMDENGDPEGNYTLIARRPSPNRPNEYGLYPVGLFQRNENASSTLALRLTLGIDWVSGQVPIDEPFCGFKGEKCVTHTSEIAAGVPGGVLLVVAIVGLVVYRNWKYEQELDSLLWKIDYKEIQINEQTPNVSNGKSVRTLHPLIRTSQVSLNSNPDSDFRYSTIYTQIGTHKGRILAVKKVKKRHVDITRKMKKELKMIRDLRHDNLNAFVGACVGPPNVCIVTEYCTRGSLKDILDNEDVKLDNMFIASLVLDTVRGMIYLHDSAIKSHGNLKSSNCLVDSRWVLKIAGFGLHDLKAEPESEDEDERRRKLEGLLYRAPELLRDPYAPHCGTQKADVYSFAIILYETHGRHGPFGGRIDMTPTEMLKRIAKRDDDRPPFRPQLELLENALDAVTDCLKECWRECAEERPDFKSIRHKLRPMRKGMKPNIFDNMIAMMEKYANNLEALVDEKTDQLVEEKKKTEALLYEMLPRYVAEQLKRGNKVEAESFDSVTIYFSDIVGFTWMSAESSPLQIVDFLNDLYTCFDSIIENYDVYKVETIGDAYMVVSGLPVRNGDQHAGEIASMSLHLLRAVRVFKIRHRPEDTLMLRIGIHSGPVCAGVVGLKMPRYCLFGDTVNTASRMESNGLPLKVHCSEQCKRTLDKVGGYYVEERGLVKIKGKGEMRTYWLAGEDQKRRWQTMQKRRTQRQNGCVKLNGPRSSLKSLVSRTVSLDSPKKLRFADVGIGYDRSPHEQAAAVDAAGGRVTSLAKGRSCPCIQDSAPAGPGPGPAVALVHSFHPYLTPTTTYCYGAPSSFVSPAHSYDASALELERTIPLLSRESSPGGDATLSVGRRHSGGSSESAPLLSRGQCECDCVCCGQHHHHVQCRAETPV